MSKFNDEYIPSVDDSFEYIVERIADKFGEEACEAFIDHIIYKEPIADLEFIYEMDGLRGLFAKIRNYIRIKKE